MTWNDFARDEKRAVIKSAAMIANADGEINDSENMYLTTLLMKMDADNQLVKDAMDMWKMNMTRTIRNMGQAKKDIVRDVWLKVMNRSCGGVFSGYTTVDSSSVEGETIISLANSCGIDVSGRYFVDEF